MRITKQFCSSLVIIWDSYINVWLIHKYSEEKSIQQHFYTFFVLSNFFCLAIFYMSSLIVSIRRERFKTLICGTSLHTKPHSAWKKNHCFPLIVQRISTDLLKTEFVFLHRKMCSNCKTQRYTMLILNLHKEISLCCLTHHLNKYKVLTFPIKMCPLCLKNMFPYRTKNCPAKTFDSWWKSMIFLCLHIITLTKICTNEDV